MRRAAQLLGLSASLCALILSQDEPRRRAKVALLVLRGCPLIWRVKFRSIHLDDRYQDDPTLHIIECSFTDRPWLRTP
jgi:hypothetical protein